MGKHPAKRTLTSIRLAQGRLEKKEETWLFGICFSFLVCTHTLHTINAFSLSDTFHPTAIHNFMYSFSFSPISYVTLYTRLELVCLLCFFFFISPGDSCEFFIRSLFKNIEFWKPDVCEHIWQGRVIQPEFIFHRQQISHQEKLTKMQRNWFQRKRNFNFNFPFLHQIIFAQRPGRAYFWESIKGSFTYTRKTI